MAHPRTAMILRRILAVASLLSLSTILATSTASAQTIRRNVLLTVTRLNPDCYPDTVLGIMEVPRMIAFPTVIRWGQAPMSRANDSGGGQSNAGGRGQADTSTGTAPQDSCGDGINQRLKVRETAIIYPDWRGFTASVAFQQMNYDSLTDVIFYLRGKVEVNGEERDTLRPLVVYGQSGLDTMMMLNLSRVASFQSGPFFASELTFGDDFINDQRRDLSDSVSWELLRKDVHLTPQDTTRHDGRDTANGRQGRRDTPVLAIHPNPSQEVAAVEAEHLPAGVWTVEVVGVNGAVYDRQEVVMNEPGNVLRTVSVRGLANGYYVLRVRNAQGIAGTYPIVVKR